MGAELRTVDRDGAADVLALLAEWTPAGAPVDALHAGDLGWQLRFEPEVLRGRCIIWSTVDTQGAWHPAAVGMRDGGDLRFAFAPHGRDDAALAARIVESLDELLPDSTSTVDVAPDAALRHLLRERGWVGTEDAWLRFVHPLAPAPARPDNAELVTEDTAAQRVHVQVNSFTSSTFTVDRWRAMTSEPGGANCVDVLARDADGEAAAAATGWLAGPGRCALLEPVGTHRDYQRRGHGRAAVVAACAELAARGASAVAVYTPAANTAAVALYVSAGFTMSALPEALIRP